MLFVPYIMFQFPQFKPKNVIYNNILKKALNFYIFRTLLVHHILLHIIVNSKTIVSRKGGGGWPRKLSPAVKSTFHETSVINTTECLPLGL